MDAWWALTTKPASFLAILSIMNAIMDMSCQAEVTEEEHASQTDCGQGQHKHANVSSNLTNISLYCRMAIVHS